MTKMDITIGDILTHHAVGCAYFTQGKDYPVQHVDDWGVMLVDDEGDDHSITFDRLEEWFNRKRMFKVGDKVRQVKKPEWNMEYDYPGGRTVSFVTDDGKGISFEGGLVCAHGHVLAERFVLVQAADEQKFDAGKTQWRLLSRHLVKPLTAVATVLTYGCKKYKVNGWQEVEPERYEDALDRHLAAWRDGELRDEESGIYHLAHAACNVLFLLWFQIKDTPLLDVTKHNNPKGVSHE